MSEPTVPNPFAGDAFATLERRLDRAVLDVTARLQALQATLAARTEQAAELERQLAVSEARLAVEMMHSAGLTAQASQLMAMALDAGVTGLDDAPDGPLARIYDAAFDAKAAELGIEDPARFRAA